MCVQPGKLKDGTEIACRKCWQCRATRINDWVGRCIAETKHAKASHAITLTYGRENGEVDHFRAAWLTYSDVQKWFKRLRFAGYQFRYLLAGEYGSQKGRAHWHVLMFWQTDPPPHDLSEVSGMEHRFNDGFWPHGAQMWQHVTDASVRYVCKYINKDADKDERQALVRMSKKPPLGDEYFRWLAVEYARNGLAPQKLTYSFPELRDKEGRPRQFHMRLTTAENFLSYYKEAWAVYQTGHEPASPVLEAYDDKLARGSYEPARGQWGRYVPPLEMGTGPYAGRDPLDGLLRCYSDLFDQRWWYRPSLEEKGEWTWQKERTGIGIGTRSSELSIRSAALREAYSRATNGA